MKNDKIKIYRKKIDNIDKTIIKEIIKRNEVVKEIGKYKSKNKISIVDKKRENEIFKSINKLAKKKSDKSIIKEIYSKLLKYSKNEQKLCSKRSK